MSSKICSHPALMCSDITVHLVYVSLHFHHSLWAIYGYVTILGLGDRSQQPEKFVFCFPESLRIPAGWELCLFTVATFFTVHFLLWWLLNANVFNGTCKQYSGTCSLNPVSCAVEHHTRSFSYSPFCLQFWGALTFPHLTVPMNSYRNQGAISELNVLKIPMRFKDKKETILEFVQQIFRAIYVLLNLKECFPAVYFP